MTNKTRPVDHMTLSDVNDELQILEYIATNSREGLTPGDRRFLQKLLTRQELLKKQDFTNAECAEFARTVIRAHASAKACAKGKQFDPNPAYCDLPDFLADLLHFCSKHNIDFDLALASARGHFTAEIAEEGGAP